MMVKHCLGPRCTKGPGPLQFDPTETTPQQRPSSTEHPSAPYLNPNSWTRKRRLLL